MKKLTVLCIALCSTISFNAAYARGGGMGSHMSTMGGGMGSHMSAMGGARRRARHQFAGHLPSDGVGNGPIKGPLLGTSPAIDKEEARVEKMMGSICRGC